LFIDFRKVDAVRSGMIEAEIEDDNRMVVCEEYENGGNISDNEMQ